MIQHKTWEFETQSSDRTLKMEGYSTEWKICYIIWNSSVVIQLNLLHQLGMQVFSVLLHVIRIFSSSSRQPYWWKVRKNKEAAQSSLFNAFFQHATCKLAQWLERQSHLRVVCASYRFSVHRWNIFSEQSICKAQNRFMIRKSKIPLPATPSSLTYPCTFSVAGWV